MLLPRRVIVPEDMSAGVLVLPFGLLTGFNVTAKADPASTPGGLVGMPAAVGDRGQTGFGALLGPGEAARAGGEALAEPSPDGPAFDVWTLAYAPASPGVLAAFDAASDVPSAPSLGEDESVLDAGVSGGLINAGAAPDPDAARGAIPPSVGVPAGAQAAVTGLGGAPEGDLEVSSGRSAPPQAVVPSVPANAQAVAPSKPSPDPGKQIVQIPSDPLPRALPIGADAKPGADAPPTPGDKPPSLPVAKPVEPSASVPVVARSSEGAPVKRWQSALPAEVRAAGPGPMSPAAVWTAPGHGDTHRPGAVPMAVADAPSSLGAEPVLRGAATGGLVEGLAADAADAGGVAKGAVTTGPQLVPASARPVVEIPATQLADVDVVGPEPTLPRSEPVVSAAAKQVLSNTPAGPGSDPVMPDANPPGGGGVRVDGGETSLPGSAQVGARSLSAIAAIGGSGAQTAIPDPIALPLAVRPVSGVAQGTTPAVSAAPVPSSIPLVTAASPRFQTSGAVAQTAMKSGGSPNALAVNTLGPGGARAETGAAGITMTSAAGTAMAVSLQIGPEPDGDPMMAFDPRLSGQMADTPVMTRSDPVMPPSQAQSGQLAAQVAGEMARHIQNAQTRFQMRFDPPELGRVDVNMKVAADGTVQAHLIVERAETLDMFLRDQRGLERALEAAGLNADPDGLKFSLKDSGSQGFGFDRDPQSGGQDEGGSSEPADNDPAVDDPSAQTVHVSMSGRADGLDIRI